MRTRAKRLTALTVLAVCAGATAPAAAPAAGFGLRACPDEMLYGLPDQPKPTADPRCGTLSVPLARDAAGAAVGRRRLRLALKLLRPRSGPARETIVVLAGGPGQDATPLLYSAAEQLGAATLRGRQLVAIDQRGTGRDALSCPSLETIRSEAQLDAGIGACARRLGDARRSYASADSVADLEALRVALGVARVTLYGTSYGTKVALDYAARHPERVERLVLDSVVPQTVDPFQLSTLAATAPMLRELCGRACPFTRDAGEDLTALVRRLRADGPLPARWYDRRGRAHTLAITPERVLGLLLAGDLNPFERAPLPAALRSAAAGDGAPLAQLLGPDVFKDGDGGPSDDDALFVATRCLDGAAPWPAGTPLAQRRAATESALAALPAEALAPFDAATLRADGGLALCRAWPEEPLPQSAAPLPDVPALLLSGTADLRTPTADAIAVARLLPRARLVTAPGVGHSVLSWDALRTGCTTRALRAFLTGGTVRDCPPARADRNTLAVRPFVPARLAALPAERAGLPPRVARTVAGLEATYGDLDWMRGLTLIASLGTDIDDPRQPKLGWGGLRGGGARQRGEYTVSSFDISDYTVVAGLRVNGRSAAIDSDDLDLRYRLRVGGAAAAHGVVTITPRRIRGRLGGRRIDLPNRASTTFAVPAAVTAGAARAAATAGEGAGGGF
ncbi:alpha/beta fold hydrolase [Conexibacter sp. JD483]|uniref:alpha/beta fold hydrolase n=1 Tax=unclassified Conexibacter TaxID=2627773 RepID=UPI002718E70A|nr:MULTISPECIES: alpha/beta fold hydrolase [unclassified Conexibacter]MDO8188775.1 alpha/beta fold hydrolase [Conexibacter sp. CPCC 205706]MDO8201714.1 alpha/beta fold hydrolase [Conexibacter sp. CPCC 205762]MDR9371375.1 alpha/beta fold hydrolase [Conexibacter sp. JD483]